MTELSRFIVGPFTAHDANLAPGDFVVGMPSPFSALGMAGAIARKAGLNGWGVAAIPVFHKIDLSAGRLRSAPVAEGKKLKPVEVSETVTGQVEFSLLMEFPGHVSTTAIARHLERSRFSGGSIFAEGNRRLIDLVHEIEGDDLPLALRRTPRGYALTPPDPDRQGYSHVSFGEKETLEEVIAASSPGDRAKGSGMMVPCPVGYRLCEDPNTALPRKGGRDQTTPHVFVDQALGVAELISIRNRTQFGSVKEAFNHLAWRWRQDPTARFSMFSPFHLEAAGLTTNNIA